MGSESIYTDNQITKVAEKVAELVLNPDALLKEAILGGDEYLKGPLAIFPLLSRQFNPFGKIAIEVEILTMAYKKIVVQIVGDAMSKISASDY